MYYFLGSFRPGELWDQLEDIDNTISLSFVWNGSHHNKFLLDSLGMHTQNIVSLGLISTTMDLDISISIVRMIYRDRLHYCLRGRLY